MLPDKAVTFRGDVCVQEVDVARNVAIMVLGKAEKPTSIHPTNMPPIRGPR